MKNRIVFITSLLITLSISAQENKINSTLGQIRECVSTGKDIQVDDEVLYNPGNEMFVLTQLATWYKDPKSEVRSEAISISARLGIKTRQAAFRQEVVRQLTQECNDKDAALAGLAINYLTHFNKNDFTKDASDSIRVLLKGKPAYIDKVVRLAGFLDLKDQQPYLEDLLVKGQSTNMQWNIHLALARMGNASSTLTLLALVKDYPVDDNIMYTIVPDLVYTRQKPIFDYLLDILNSDKKSCTSPNPYYSSSILCGYRVMEEMCNIVKDFPLKKNKGGDMITDNYEKALQTARTWFKEHDAYEFNMEVY